MTYVRRILADVAMGRKAPDLVIRNVQLVNVLSREIYPADIVVSSGRIAAVLPPGGDVGDAGRVIDGEGLFAAPGFIDPHVHLESSMVTVRQYASAVIPRGTTMIAADPHEIGNVLGAPGMRALFDDAASTPLRVRLRVPGRIPAVPEWMETSNARLDVADTRALFDWPEALCLAGDINPNLVLKGDAEQFEKFEMAERLRVPISGQSPGLTGRALCAFIAAGPEDSHVAGSVDEIIENTRLGLSSVLALRSMRLGMNEFRALCERVKSAGVDTRQFQICTDDIHAHDLLSEGHLDHRMRALIEAGFDPIEVYQFATLNVAQAMRIAHDHGSIAPGKIADIVLLDDLAKVSVKATIIGGEVVYGDGVYSGDASVPSYPEWSLRTIRYAAKLAPRDLAIAAHGNAETTRVRSLSGARPGKLKSLQEIELPVRDGFIQADPELGIVCMAMIERHKASGEIGKGFSDVVRLQRGAIACSVNHDAHNVAVFGVSHDDMALAANRLAEIGGGYVVALDGEIIAELPLPIAGLISDRPIGEVAEAFVKIRQTTQDMLGAQKSDKLLMEMNFLALPNIPNYGFTNKGLVASDGRMRPISCLCHEDL
jgi:adenine deaminase